MKEKQCYKQGDPSLDFFRFHSPSRGHASNPPITNAAGANLLKNDRKAFACLCEPAFMWKGIHG